MKFIAKNILYYLANRLSKEIKTTPESNVKDMRNRINAYREAAARLSLHITLNLNTVLKTK
jgi:hypothetical protein